MQLVACEKLSIQKGHLRLRAGFGRDTRYQRLLCCRHRHTFKLPFFLKHTHITVCTHTQTNTLSFCEVGFELRGYTLPAVAALVALLKFGRCGLNQRLLCFFCFSSSLFPLTSFSLKHNIYVVCAHMCNTHVKCVLYLCPATKFDFVCGVR